MVLQMPRRTLVVIVSAAATLVAASLLAIAQRTDSTTTRPRAGNDAVSQMVAASSRPVPAAEQKVPEAAIEMLQLRRAEIRHLATFRVRGGQHRLFIAPTAKGETCLVEDVESGTTPDGRPLRVYGGSCSPDVWLGHRIAWTIHSSGANGDRQRLTLVGVARPSVASVALVNALGERRVASLTPTSAFVFDLSAAENALFEPVAIVALDGVGRGVDRMSLR